MARPRISPQPEVPGLAARRIAADILDGVLRRKIALDEQLSGKAAHPGLADARRPRPRADAPARRHRAAAARHLAPPARRISRQGLSVRRAARRNHSADRRCANPLAGSARPRRGRFVGAPGASRSPRRALWRTDQRGAAPRGAEPERATRRSAFPRHAEMAAGALDQALWRRNRARDRRRQRPRARARPHRQIRA